MRAGLGVLPPSDGEMGMCQPNLRWFSGVPVFPACCHGGKPGIAAPCLLYVLCSPVKLSLRNCGGVEHRGAASAEKSCLSLEGSGCNCN